MGDFYDLCLRLNSVLYTDSFDEEYYRRILQIVADYYGAQNVRILLHKEHHRPEDLMSLMPISGEVDSDDVISAKVSEDVSVEVVKPGIKDSKALLFIATYLNNIIKFGNKIIDLQTDKLTGLMNNNTLIDLLKDKSIRQNVGILFMDANDLREINNTQGHDAGDKLLITLAMCMRGSIRKRELYRRGGDEFVAICQNIPEDVFNEKIAEIHKAIAKTPYTAAIGTSYRETCTSLEDMIKEADTNMYQNKAEFKAARKAIQEGMAIRQRTRKEG